jgi:hypothetical protein
MNEALEKLFRETLKEVTVTPPERVWRRIDAHFAAKQRRFHPWFAYGSAAAVIILLLSWPLFFSTVREDTPVLVTHIAPGVPILVPSPSPATFSRPAASRAPRQQMPRVDNEVFDPVIPSPGYLPETIVSNHPITLALEPMVSRNTIPLINGVSVNNARKYYRLLMPESFESSRVPVQEELKSAKRERRTDVKYAVSGYVSPGYSSGEYNAIENAPVFEESQMGGIYNLNGGLAFAVHTGKRLAVETGIGFSRVGQKIDIKYHTSMSLSQAARNVITPLGRVNNSAKAVVVFQNSNEEILEGVRSYQSGTLEQRFDALDIPLYLRYYIHNAKLKFSVVGGLGAHVLVNNRTYLLSSDSRENLGTTEDIRTLNFSTRLGLGVEYPIVRALYFKFEPAFRYYLQSISDNKNIDFKPYSFNLSTGIGVRF